MNIFGEGEYYKHLATLGFIKAFLQDYEGKKQQNQHKQQGGMDLPPQKPSSLVKGCRGGPKNPTKNRKKMALLITKPESHNPIMPAHSFQLLQAQRNELHIPSPVSRI